MATKEYRHIRVFLSSTFIDMQRERDALVKLFRRLALEGRKHNVSITLLDLRWGITDDQKRNGMVISTCLQEIDNSRPFFIGLLGERYGWIPSPGELEDNTELTSRFPRIAEYGSKGLSITEIEMRHGVLDEMRAECALFMMKKGLQPESEKHKNLLTDINLSENTELHEYASIDELIYVIENKFIKIIQENETAATNDNYEQIKKEQERILSEKQEGYIATSHYHKTLDEWLEGKDNTILVTGDEGVGKSSLVAAWIAENSARFDKVIYYFIGEGDRVDSPINIQKYIIKELENRYNYDFQINEEEKLDWDDDYSFFLEQALSMVGQNNERLLLAVDGLDHIAGNGIEKFLYWLPDMPESVKAIYSTNKNDLTFNSLNEIRKVPVLEMESFSFDHTKKIILSYLANFSKALDDELVTLIASNHIFRNGASLRILLDDLVAYGVHEQLPAQVKKYASASDKQSFFNLIIERAEEFYGKDIIENILTLLLISKYGFDETDIRDILHLEPLQWSEIYCGMRQYLVFVNGKYKLRYPELIEALISRYGDEEAIKNEDKGLLLSKAIVSHLKDREGQEEEVAFQAFTLGDTKLLHEVLSPYHVAKRMVTEDEAWMGRYWDLLQDNGYSFEEYLDKMPDEKEELGDVAYSFSQFAFLDLNKYDMAKKFIHKYVDFLGDTEDDEKEKPDCYLLIARMGEQYGKIEEASDYLEKAYTFLDKYYDHDCWDFYSYYFTLGNVLYAKGSFEEALEAHRMAERLAMKDKYADDSDRWSHLNRIGLDLMGLQRYDKAEQTLRKALEYNSSQMTSLSYEASQIINNIGYCLMLQDKDLDEAEECFLKAIGQMSAAVGEYNMQLYLPVTNLGQLYLQKEDFENAKETFQRAYEILSENEESATEEQFGNVYLNMGVAESGLGNHDESIRMLKTIIKNMDYNGIVEQAYDKLGDEYYDSGKFDDILKLYEKWDKEAKAFYEGPNYASAYARRVRGNVYAETGKFKKAYKEYKSALAIYEALGDEEEAQEIRSVLD